MSAAVQPLRHAARQLVRELHLLDGRVACCGIPLAECHLITELNRVGQATATELCERLVLEKSTVSRLVNRLVEKGFIRAASCEDDKRTRILCLTGKGKAQAERLDRHASAQVEAALGFVAPGGESSIIEGLQRYANALRSARLAGGYLVRPIEAGDNEALASVLREVMAEFGATGCGTSFSDAEVDAMFEAYSAPGCAFLVVEKDGRILGGGGFGPLAGGAEDVCELRKMYFLPELRGAGMGLRLLRLILDSARAAGYRECYLETMQGMDQALRLYRKYGFKELEARIGSTGHRVCNRFMSLNL